MAGHEATLKKYREASAKAAAAELNRLDPKRELSAKEHDLFAAKIEELFHVKLPRLAPTPTPPHPNPHRH